jgi:hypothetical protein
VEDKIIQEIEQLRKKMVTYGMKLGLQHPLVLAYSKRIDTLHNQLLFYQGLPIHPNVELSLA